MGLFGSSKKKTTTNNTTSYSNVDNRVVQAEGATNVGPKSNYSSSANTTDNSVFNQSTSMTDARTFASSSSEFYSDNDTSNLTDSRSWMDMSSQTHAFDDHSVYNALDPETVARALDFAEGADAVAADGYSRLLGTSAGLFDSAGAMMTGAAERESSGMAGLLDMVGRLFEDNKAMVSQTRDTLADAYGDAYSMAGAAQVDGQGRIDQKTMIVLAAIAAAGLYLMRARA